jgi:hypothetical protein
MKNTILLIVIIFNSSIIYGQEIVSGDSTIVFKIKEKTSWIYENKDKTNFLLTNQQLQEIQTNGTNITVQSKNGEINRIITISNTENGQLSAEWYFDDNQLIFAYQSFEYFKESEHQSEWKNFKGIWGWESRHYFIDEELKYSKHMGLKKLEIKSDKNSILITARRILNYAIGQIK